MFSGDEIDAVIFDLDGLVLDTEASFRAAWQAAAITLEYDFPAPFLESLSGLSWDAVIQQMSDFGGSHFNADKFRVVSAACWRDHVQLHGIAVKVGFHQLIARLIDLNTPYCLATNSGFANAKACLELAGIGPIFSTIIARDHVAAGKPAPDLFLAAAEALQVPVGRCLVLEDSRVGIEAAVSAGAIPVMVPSTYPVSPSTLTQCRHVLTDLIQVAALFHG